MTLRHSEPKAEPRAERESLLVRLERGEKALEAANAALGDLTERLAHGIVHLPQPTQAEELGVDRPRVVPPPISDLRARVEALIGKIECLGQAIDTLRHMVDL